MMQFTDMKQDDPSTSSAATGDSGSQHPPHPPTNGQSGAFGGNPYDASADVDATDDFVLDMDEIPDFSLDDDASGSDEGVTDMPDTASVSGSSSPTQETSPSGGTTADQERAGSASISMGGDTISRADSIKQPQDNDFSLDLDALDADSDKNQVHDADTSIVHESDKGTISHEDISDDSDHVDSDSFDLGDLSIEGNSADADESTTQPSTSSDKVSSERVSAVSGEGSDNHHDAAIDNEQTTTTDRVVGDVDGLDDTIVHVDDAGKSVDESGESDNSGSQYDDVSGADLTISSDTALDTAQMSRLGSKCATVLDILGTIRDMDDADSICILGASHGREEVYYRFSTDDRSVVVVRDATDADGKHQQDTLTCTLGEQDLVVRLDDVVILDEGSDNDMLMKYQHTVSEKLGKFEMLLNEYLTTIKKKQAQENAAAAIKTAGKKLQDF